MPLGFIIRLATRYPKSFFGGLLLLAGLGWLGQSLEQRTLKRETAEAPAEVLTVTYFRNNDHTDVTFRYLVNGQTLTGHSDKDGNMMTHYPAGTNYKVCYNPAQPTEAEIYELGHQCGQ